MFSKSFWLRWLRDDKDTQKHLDLEIQGTRLVMDRVRYAFRGGRNSSRIGE